MLMTVCHHSRIRSIDPFPFEKAVPSNLITPALSRTCLPIIVASGSISALFPRPLNMGRVTEKYDKRTTEAESKRNEAETRRRGGLKLGGHPTTHGCECSFAAQPLSPTPRFSPSSAYIGGPLRSESSGPTPLAALRLMITRSGMVRTRVVTNSGKKQGRVNESYHDQPLPTNRGLSVPSSASISTLTAAYRESFHFVK